MRNKAHEFVAALGHRGRGLEGPEHRDTQGGRHDYGEGDVEVLAHATRLTALGAERKLKLSLGEFAFKAKAAYNQGLGVPTRARIRVGDRTKLSLDFLNKLRYNICYTI